MIAGRYRELGPRAVIGEDCIVHGCVEGTIGDRTKVWRFAHVMEGAIVGDDCQVCNGAIILPDVVIGDRTDIQLFCGIARLARIGDDCFIGPGTMFCNSKNPQRGMSHDQLQRITVGNRVSIGANCSLLPGISIGDDAVIGAGAIVACDVPAGAKFRMNTKAVRVP